MRLGTVLCDDGRQVAVIAHEGGLYDVDRLVASLDEPSTLKTGGTGPRGSLRVLDLVGDEAGFLSLVAALDRKAESFEHARLDTDEPRLLAPIPRPAKNVFCLGRNYADHIQEDNSARSLQTELPKHPQFFSKPPTSVIGPDAPVRLDERVTRRLDYEVELAIVIGRGGRDIPAAEAMSHVFGYCVLNDITARDLQRRHDQWFKGKALDESCPMGPWIVHSSAIDDPHALGIRLHVNGEPRQDASTASMIFRIPRIIESLSAGLTLEAGDIIATGTPAGVGYAMDPPRYLKPGDEIRCEIDGIGVLINRIEAAPMASS